MYSLLLFFLFSFFIWYIRGHLCHIFQDQKLNQILWRNNEGVNVVHSILRCRTVSPLHRLCVSSSGRFCFRVPIFRPFVIGHLTGCCPSGPLVWFVSRMPNFFPAHIVHPQLQSRPKERNVLNLGVNQWSIYIDDIIWYHMGCSHEAALSTLSNWQEIFFSCRPWRTDNKIP